MAHAGLRILRVNLSRVHDAGIGVPQLVRCGRDPDLIPVFLDHPLQPGFVGQAVREEDKRLRILVLRKDLQHVIIQINLALTGLRLRAILHEREIPVKSQVLRDPRLVETSVDILLLQHGGIP